MWLRWVKAYEAKHNWMFREAKTHRLTGSIQGTRGTLSKGNAVLGSILNKKVNWSYTYFHENHWGQRCGKCIRGGPWEEAGKRIMEPEIYKMYQMGHDIRKHVSLILLQVLLGWQDGNISNVVGTSLTILCEITVK